MGGLFHFKHQQWSSLDLSYARLAHLRFSAASISNCVFEDAGCRDWRLWDSQIESSSFARADLRDAAIATWYEAKTNDWRGVRFDGADLRGGVAIGGSFVDSSFRGAKLDGVEFQQSHIERCTFDGLMRDVIFDGRDLPDKPRPTPLRRVDFSGAVFEDVAFRGCSFDDVRMPDIPGIRVIRRYPVIARRVLALAEATTSVEGRMLASELRNALKRPGADDSIAVLNRRDYLAAGGESFADFAEALFMEAENLAG